MAIFNVFDCPVCRARTHHRFHDCLRERFICRSHWECLACGTKTPLRSINPVAEKKEGQDFADHPRSS